MLSSKYKGDRVLTRMEKTVIDIGAAHWNVSFIFGWLVVLSYSAYVIEGFPRHLMRFYNLSSSIIQSRFHLT